MTAIEMIENVKIGIDKTNSLIDSVNFEEDEILYWLNEAQYELLKQKLFGNNFRREGYDDLHSGAITKRSDDISNLIRYSNKLEYSTDPTNYPYFRPHAYHPNIAVVNLIGAAFSDSSKIIVPHYMYYIGADLKVTVNEDGSDDGSAPMETVIIEQKNIGDFVETPTNKPFLRNAFVYLKEGEANFIYDPFKKPVWVYISYVMEPRKIVTSGGSLTNWTTSYTHIWWENEDATQGLWPTSVHSEIVALAVSLILENIADPRYQTNKIELSRKE